MNRLIGITGLMSSGKSTLSKQLVDNFDYIYVDVDVFRRDLYNNETYIKELKGVIKGLCNYEKVDSLILNKFIYSNNLDMENYKKILYRYLKDYLASFSNKTIIVEWALILSDDMLDMFDKVIYVDTSKEEILRRLEDSDLSEEEILTRLSLQEIDISKYKMDKIMFVSGNKEFDVLEVNDFIKGMNCKFTLPNGEGKVIWEITHACNYGCSYCIFSCNSKRDSDELTTEECFHVIDELVNHGYKHLKITGGEPFIRKDIIDILKYASQRLVTDISTNASLITKDIVNKLNELDLKMIHVSLDGNKEEHEKVRGINTYDRTIRGLNYLKDSRNRIRIGSVIHANNENNLEDLVRNVKDFGVSEIILSIMEPVEGQDRSQVKKRSNEELSKEIEKIKDKYHDDIIVSYNFLQQPSYVKKCPAGDKFLYINNVGLISPCPWVHEKDKNCISKISLRNHCLEEVLRDNNLVRFNQVKGEGKCYGEI